MTQTTEQRPARSGSGSSAGGPIRRSATFYRQVVAELRKVIWPTRKELITYTIVTLVFSVIMIMIVFAVDYGANWSVLKIWG